MRLPDFLIIGAMKAGTTTLFEDLQTHPRVFMPLDKEPHNLCHDAVLTEAGRSAYAALFAAARADQVCAEASTGYTKLPDYPGVPARAVRVLGAGLRVIYLVREPVARIISHHHHAYGNGKCGAQIDREVRERPMFLDWTRYATQITPWIDALGRERVLVIRFESYVADRRGTVERVSRFLGIEPRPELIDASRAYNAAEAKVVNRGRFAWVSRNAVYRAVVRPLLSDGLKARARRLLLPRAPRRPDPPSPQTVEWILGELAEEMERLRTIMGEPGPLWDAAEVQRRFGPSENPSRGRGSAGAEAVAYATGPFQRAGHEPGRAPSRR